MPSPTNVGIVDDHAVQGSASEQAQIVARAQNEYDAAPTPSRELKLALVLATPGHPATDQPRAQRLLRELIEDTLEDIVLSMINSKETAHV